MRTGLPVAPLLIHVDRIVTKKHICYVFMHRSTLLELASTNSIARKHIGGLFSTSIGRLAVREITLTARCSITELATARPPWRRCHNSPVNGDAGHVSWSRDVTNSGAGSHALSRSRSLQYPATHRARCHPPDAAAAAAADILQCG